MSSHISSDEDDLFDVDPDGNVDEGDGDGGGNPNATTLWRINHLSGDHKLHGWCDPLE
jgi:hypothetical protein